jgi:hypothetical protein
MYPKLLKRYTYTTQYTLKVNARYTNSRGISLTQNRMGDFGNLGVLNGVLYTAQTGVVPQTG